MSRLLLLAFVALTIFALPPTATAGNGDELTQMSRHLCTSCKYGDPRKCACKKPHNPCQDCQMSWQPIRSIMHPNMLPAGMIRPKPPLNRMIQNLIPKMPTKWLDKCQPWSGCKDGNCKAP